MSNGHKVTIRIFESVCAAVALSAFLACSSAASSETPDAASSPSNMASSPDSSSEAGIPAPGDICYGTEIALDRAWSECATDRDPEAPPVDSVDVSIDPLSFATGEAATAKLLIENITDDPLELVVRERPDADVPFVEVALLADGKRTDEVHDPAQPMLGGVMSRPCTGEEQCQTAKVILVPGGVLKTELEIPTRVTRHIYEPTDDSSGSVVALTESIDDGPIDAGSYQLRLRFPSWRIWLSDRHSRSFEAELDVELLAE